MFGAVPGFAPLCWDANDPRVVFNGVASRLLRTLPVPVESELVELEKFVASFLDRMFVPHVDPLPFEDWLETTNYGEERKTQLRRAFNDLRGGKPTARQRTKVLLFGKTENYVAYKTQRGIYSRNDFCKVWAGPYIKALEKVVYEWRDEEGDNYFIKHVPVVDRPRFISKFVRSGNKYYSNDFTAYESHFTKRIIKICEGQLYKRALGHFGAEYTSMLCGKNVLSTRDKRVKIITHAHRMSGEMSTSLGNGFTNLMLNLYLAHREGFHMKVVVEGDDSLISTPVPLDAKWYAELGFTIKCEEIFEPGDASFCGMLCTDSGEIIKNPVKFLSNFGWTHNMINAGPKVLDSLLRAKALSACYETPQCPILGVLAREALKKTRYVRARFIQDGYHDRIPDEFPIPAFNPALSTRLSFQRNFGVSVDAQLQAEEAIRHNLFSRIQDFVPPAEPILDYISKYVIVDSKDSFS